MIHVEISPVQLVSGQKVPLKVLLQNCGGERYTRIELSLRLPAQFTLWEGCRVIQLPALDPGECKEFRLTIQASRAGIATLTSRIFAYRNASGIVRHQEALWAVLEVREGVDDKPRIELGLTTAELPHQNWDLLEGWVENCGSSALSSLCVKAMVQGGDVSDLLPDWRFESDLLPGAKEVFSLPVWAGQLGESVPVSLSASSKRSLVLDNRHFLIRVSPNAKKRGPEPVRRRIRILFVAAEPLGSNYGGEVRSDFEYEDIKKTLEERAGGRFEIYPRFACTVRALSSLLCEKKPDIVHFSGHGDDGQLVFVDERGGARLVTPEDFANLLLVTAKSVQCVIFNACDSARHAQAVARYVPYAIGMNGRHSLGRSTEFSIIFYQSLVGEGGLTIKEAFQRGCRHMGCMRYPPELWPCLKEREASS